MSLNNLWMFPREGYADPPPSVLIWVLWMMQSVLNRMRNKIQKKSDFIFRVIVKNS